MNTILTIEEYSEQIGVPKEEIKGTSRRYEHKIPRHLYWLYLYLQTDLSKRAIARKFNMAYSSVHNGIKSISNLIETEDKILSDYESFISTFLHQQESN